MKDAWIVLPAGGAPVLSREPKHGTRGEYDYWGCRCRECKDVVRDRARDYYHNRGGKEAYKVRRDNIYAEIVRAKDVPCTDCNTKYPAYVMQFDHVRGTKSRDVSRLLASGLTAVLREIELCEVVCANCHAERTYRRNHPELEGVLLHE